MKNTNFASKKTRSMLKVKTHLKAGQQGQAVCPVPQKAYQDGYTAGYGDAQIKGPRYASGGGWVPPVWRPY